MLSVVIPALNEEGAIEQTVKDVSAVLKGAGYDTFEVIVVNDGSTDRTAEIAAAAGAQVVSHLTNLGYGKSLKDGITASSYDTIVITDADGTYPINQIPELLEEYALGYDMIVGQRQGEFYKESWLKRPLRAVLRFIVEFTAGKRIPDINSGLRVFSRGTILPYFNQLCNTFSFTTSATLAYFMTGKHLKYVPIEYHERVGDTKVRLVKDSLRTLQYIVQAILYYNPLKLFVLFCAVTMSFAIVCFLLALVAQLTSAFLLGVGSVLVTFVVFSIGLVADQLRQVLLRQDAELQSNSELSGLRGEFTLPSRSATKSENAQEQQQPERAYTQ